MKSYNAALLSIALISLSCSKNTTGNVAADYTPIQSVSQVIHASAGGTLINKNGVSLTIPPGALSSDTLITVSEIVIPKEDHNTIAGVKFEPDGLELKKPAILEVPLNLPSDWDENDLILDYGYHGKDAAAGAWNGYYIQVSRENGKLIARTFTTHFSGTLFVRNCHSGTMDYVLGQFNKKGQKPDSLLTAVRQKYPGETIQGYQTDQVDERTIQRFLGTFFTEKYTFNRSTKIPDTVISELKALCREGRQVVLSFTPDTWGGKNAEGLYPYFTHTAALEDKNGTIQIRNSTNVSPIPKLIELLGGSNTIYYPLDKINEFRELQSGVAVEMAAGVGPDGFSNESNNNPYGLKLYPPLNGTSWVGPAWENPFAFVSSLINTGTKDVKGKPPRSRPWTAVKVYVQNPEKTPVALEGFDKCYIHLDNLKCLFSNGNQWSVSSYTWEGKGGFEGYTFSASSDTILSSYHYTTTIKIELDTSLSKLKNFTAEYKYTFSGSSTNTIYSYQVDGINLKKDGLEPTSYQLVFVASGANLKNYITKFSLSSRVNGVESNTVKQFEILDNTYFSIVIWNSKK
jgi:hypothetical protein